MIRKEVYTRNTFVMKEFSRLIKSFDHRTNFLNGGNAKKFVKKLNQCQRIDDHYTKEFLYGIKPKQ